MGPRFGVMLALDTLVGLELIPECRISGVVTSELQLQLAINFFSGASGTEVSTPGSIGNNSQDRQSSLHEGILHLRFTLRLFKLPVSA